MARVIWGDFVVGRAAWGLLVMRVVFGGALIVHGLHKIHAPASWLSASAPEMSRVPAALQFLVCAGELAGGAALLVGFLTPLAAAGVALMMLGAAFVVHGAPVGFARWRAVERELVRLRGLGVADAVRRAGPVVAGCVARAPAGATMRKQAQVLVAALSLPSAGRTSP